MGSELKIADLTKSFGDKQVLQGLNLTVRAGEFVSLLGPSGCGKTTTLNIIAGFFLPESGQVVLGDRDITNLPSYSRGLAMVFQNYALFPHMTVAENIAFALQMAGQSRQAMAKRVAEMLDLVRLPGLEQRYPRQLSGGQQQRIGLARALAPQPPLLLLDEPMSNLDAKLRRQMQTELREILTSVGTTTLYVTHDQEEALTMSDRIVVMNAGRVEQVGAPRDVYDRPATRFVAGFVGESNFVEAVAGVNDGANLRVSLANGDAITVPLAGSQIKQGEKILLAVRPEAIRITSCGQPGLVGRIDAAAFAGTNTRLEVSVPALGRFQCEIPSRDGFHAERGQHVSLQIADANWIIVAERDATT